MDQDTELACVESTGYIRSVESALDRIGAGKILAAQDTILLKPNLVEDSPPPVTTPVEFTEAVIIYIRKHSRADIVIAEGCGDPKMETTQVFENLGYDSLAAKYKVELLDLNHAGLAHIHKPECPVFPEMRLPEILFRSYVVSLPVLKAHSMAVITGALKNMVGVAPPKYYSGTHGIWRKSTFHKHMQQSILDLNQYCPPDLSVMDASIGLPDYHLGGRRCDPPVGKILAGFDPWLVDREAASLLGLSWRDIGHLREKK